MEELEACLVNQHWQNAGRRTGSAIGHHEWHDEGCQQRGDRGGGDKEQTRREQRQRDVAYHSPARRAVDRGGFAELGRNALQTSEKNEGGVAEPPPDAHNDDAVQRVLGGRQPGQRIYPEQTEAIVHHTARPKQQTPDDGGNDRRYHNRHKVYDLEEPTQAQALVQKQRQPERQENQWDG